MNTLTKIYDLVPIKGTGKVVVIFELKFANGDIAYSSVVWNENKVTFAVGDTVNIMYGDKSKAKCPILYAYPVILSNTGK